MLSVEEGARLQELLDQGVYVSHGVYLFLTPREMEEFRGLVEKALDGLAAQLPKQKKA
jgi:hypothetical protein